MSAEVVRLEGDSIVLGLREFELLSERVFGEHLSSHEFYVRYSDGFYDQPFATMWAIFYETAGSLDLDIPESSLSHAIRELAGA